MEIRNEITQELNTQNLITFQENINKAKMSRDKFVEFIYLKNAVKCIINIIEEDEADKFKEIIKECEKSLKYYTFSQKVKNNVATYPEETFWDIERMMSSKDTKNEPTKRQIIDRAALFESNVSLLDDLIDKLKIRYGLLDKLRPVNVEE